MTKPEYADVAWRRVRRYVLVRDGHLCQLRFDGCRVHADAVDHIVSISQGGARLDPANLQAACITCNSRKRHGVTSVRPSSGWI